MGQFGPVLKQCFKWKLQENFPSNRTNTINIVSFKSLEKIILYSTGPCTVHLYVAYLNYGICLWRQTNSTNNKKIFDHLLC